MCKFVKFCKEFRLDDEKMINLLKLLYELCKSGEYWKSIFLKHIQMVMHTETRISNPAFFHKVSNQKLVVLRATCVEDPLHARNVNYADFSKRTELKSNCKDRVWNIPQFKDFKWKQKADFASCIGQSTSKIFKICKNTLIFFPPNCYVLKLLGQQSNAQITVAILPFFVRLPMIWSIVIVLPR